MFSNGLMALKFKDLQVITAIDVIFTEEKCVKLEISLLCLRVLDLNIIGKRRDIILNCRKSQIKLVITLHKPR